MPVCTGEDSAEGKAACVSQFVGAALTDSARKQLGDSSTTLAQAVDSPSVELRLQVHSPASASQYQPCLYQKDAMH